MWRAKIDLQREEEMRIAEDAYLLLRAASRLLLNYTPPRGSVPPQCFVCISEARTAYLETVLSPEAAHVA